MNCDLSMQDVNTGLCQSVGLYIRILTLKVSTEVWFYLFLCDAINLVSSLQWRIPFPTNIHGVRRDEFSRYMHCS